MPRDPDPRPAGPALRAVDPKTWTRVWGEMSEVVVPETSEMTVAVAEVAMPADVVLTLEMSVAVPATMSPTASEGVPR